METTDEKLAQRWHERWSAVDPNHEKYSACWCCCWTCDPDADDGIPNPYYVTAMWALLERGRPA